MSKFKLDTSKFVNVANDTKKLADELENVILKCSNTINKLYGDWSGETRNEFEKKYKIFDSQVTDIKNGLWDLYEDVYKRQLHPRNLHRKFRFQNNNLCSRNSTRMYLLE